MADKPFKRVGSYDLFNCVGQGSFASVYRGTHRPTGKVIAVKAIIRARLNRKLQENLDAEIRILQSTDHPNVMRLHEVLGTEQHVYLVLEYCPGGDLMQVINTKGAQSEAQTRHYLVQLAHGLAYLRQRNLIHRDLKPQNLLLSSAGPDGVLKIGDFGFARYMVQQDLAETLCGSPLYMAPEILRFHKCGPWRPDATFCMHPLRRSHISLASRPVRRDAQPNPQYPPPLVCAGMTPRPICGPLAPSCLSC